MKRSWLSPGAVRAALPVFTIVGATLAGVFVGIEIAILVVASGALVAVIALVWASVQSLTGESELSLEEAMALAAPSTEEEQKRAVLRALKDLEFERSVGKISEEDYAELSERYRAEAKRLMRSLDEHSLPEREKVEKLLAARLAEPARPKPKVKSTSSDDDATPSERGLELTEAAEAKSTPDVPPSSDAQPSSEDPEKIEKTDTAREAGGES
jgi:hypothetical protein